MSKDARRKNRNAGEKDGRRREKGRTPGHKIRPRREPTTWNGHELVCKCGAAAYTDHVRRCQDDGHPAHIYQPDKLAAHLHTH